MINDRKVVIVNQASNYLTIDLANSFQQRFKHVSLITGSIHTQGEELHQSIIVTNINHWVERPPLKKLASYLYALIRIFWLLLTKYRRYEVLFISLPPMAYLLNLILPHRFSMLIWDVYPDVFKITGMSERHLIFRTWAYLNKRSFRKAYKIYTIGNRMAEALDNYVNKSKLLVTPIWSISQNFQRIPKSKNIFINKYQLDGKFIVQYSGNIGLTHKVEVLVDIAAQMIEHEHILFQIIGRGPRVAKLRKIVEERNLTNCLFLDFQSDEMFPHSLSAAHLGVVILDENIAKGSVPSKSYNLMSFGIPSLYIAPEYSELADYAKRYNHAKCFTEQQLNEAANFIIQLSIDESLHQELSKNAHNAAKNFTRTNADSIVDLYLTDK